MRGDHWNEVTGGVLSKATQRIVCGNIRIELTPGSSVLHSRGQSYRRTVASLRVESQKPSSGR